VGEGVAAREARPRAVGLAAADAADDAHIFGGGYR
jgi:hypothetical protein